MRPDQLRAALAGLDPAMDVAPDGSGARARLQVGAVQVTVRAAGDGLAAEARSPAASPLHLEAHLDALGELVVATSDEGFVEALLADGGRGALRRLLSGPARARLALGRWRFERVRAAPADLVRAAGFLAARPLALGRRWMALAGALGVDWDGEWNTRGGTRLRIGTGRAEATIELVALDPDGGPTRLRTVVARGGDGWPEASAIRSRSPVRLDDRSGQRLEGAGFARVWLDGLVDAPGEVARLAAMIGVRLEVKGAAGVATTAGGADIEPMPIADWPASRAALAGGPAAAGRGRWTLRPMPGSDAVPGLDESVDIEGVEVATRCEVPTVTTDAVQWRTRVGAGAPAAPRLRARAGHHFFFSSLRRDDQLDDGGAVDDRYIVHADDLPWCRWWLGRIERDALLATFDPQAVQPFALTLGDDQIELAAGYLPPRPYLDAARQAVAFLASRALRAADEWRVLAPALGATVRGTAWALDGRFALECDRGAARVVIDFVAEDELRTRVSAPLVGEAGGRLVAWPEGTPRRRRPRPAGLDDVDDRIEVGGLRGRADPHAWAETRLRGCATPLERAAPEVLVVSERRVELSWAGPVVDETRLAGAVDAVAYLAVEMEGGGDGPYR